MKVWDVDPTKSIGIHLLSLETGQQIDTEIFEMNKNRFFIHLRGPSRTSWAVKGKRYPREIKLHLDQANDTDQPFDQDNEADSTLLNVELLYLKCSQFFAPPSPSMCLVIDQEPAFDCMDNPAWMVLKGKTPGLPSSPESETLNRRGKANLGAIVPPKSRCPTPTTSTTVPKTLYISSIVHDSDQETKSDPTIRKSSLPEQVDDCTNVKFMNKRDFFYILHLIFSEFVALALFFVNMFACKAVHFQNDLCLRVDILLCVLMIGAKLFFHIFILKCPQVRLRPKWIFSVLNVAILLINGVTGFRFSNEDKLSTHQKSLLGLLILLNLLEFLYLCSPTSKG